MKKLMAIILSVILLSATAAYAEQPETVFFEAILTKAAHTSAEDWMNNSETRAFLTMCMLIDYKISLKDGEPGFDLNIDSNISYAGRNGMMLAVAFLSSDKTKELLLICNTESQQAAYSIMDVSGQSAAEAGLNASCEDGYYMNDISEMYAASKALMDALDE